MKDSHPCCCSLTAPLVLYTVAASLEAPPLLLCNLYLTLVPRCFPLAANHLPAHEIQAVFWLSPKMAQKYDIMEYNKKVLNVVRYLKGIDAILANALINYSYAAYFSYITMCCKPTSDFSPDSCLPATVLHAQSRTAAPLLPALSLATFARIPAVTVQP